MKYIKQEVYSFVERREEGEESEKIKYTLIKEEVKIDGGKITYVMEAIEGKEGDERHMDMLRHVAEVFMRGLKMKGIKYKKLKNGVEIELGRNVLEKIYKRMK